QLPDQSFSSFFSIFHRFLSSLPPCFGLYRRIHPPFHYNFACPLFPGLITQV
ncbi:hypothetical protein PRIPAC_70022, partial [Pristionchus pacificus]